LVTCGSGEEMRAAIASLEAELGLSRPVVGVVGATHAAKVVEYQKNIPVDAGDYRG